MKRVIALFCASLLLVTILSSCDSGMFGVGYATQTKTLSSEATKEEQEEVKTQVMKSLEEYYKQPFELESFKYEYKTSNVKGSYEFQKYGTYHFKIKAVNNPIISTDFYIADNEKESTNSLIDSFKKNQLNSIYCMGLTNYYSDIVNKGRPLIKGASKEAEEYCNEHNQDEYKRAKNYYLKHHVS